MIEETLANFLNSKLSVDCFPNVKPQDSDSTNFIVYKKISDISTRSTTKEKLMNTAHFFISAYSDTYQGVKAISGSIISNLDMNTQGFKCSWKNDDKDVISESPSTLQRVDLDFFILY